MLFCVCNPVRMPLNILKCSDRVWNAQIILAPQRHPVFSRGTALRPFSSCWLLIISVPLCLSSQVLMTSTQLISRLLTRDAVLLADSSVFPCPQWGFHDNRPVLGHQFGSAGFVHPVLAAQPGQRRQRGERRQSPDRSHHAHRLLTQVRTHAPVPLQDGTLSAITDSRFCIAGSPDLST